MLGALSGTSYVLSSTPSLLVLRSGLVAGVGSREEFHLLHHHRRQPFDHDHGRDRPNVLLRRLVRPRRRPEAVEGESFASYAVIRCFVNIKCLHNVQLLENGLFFRGGGCMCLHLHSILELQYIQRLFLCCLVSIRFSLGGAFPGSGAHFSFRGVVLRFQLSWCVYGDALE